ncbi:MAG: hypothetical protein GY953_06535, partial [bacterium]|nr:hypothetical protein [bacterium]
MIDAVLDAASGGERIGLNTIVSIYGKDLAPCTEQAGGELPTSMCDGGARVLNNGTPLGLFFASENQINALFAGDLPLGAGQLRVINREESAGTAVTVHSRSPQIFVIPRFEDRRGGFAAIQRFPSYGLVDFTAPAESDEVLVIYGTGFGIHPADPLP